MEPKAKIEQNLGESGKSKDFQGILGGGADQDRTGDLLNAIQALSRTELQPHRGKSSAILPEVAISVKDRIGRRAGRPLAPAF